MTGVCGGVALIPHGSMCDSSFVASEPLPQDIVSDSTRAKGKSVMFLWLLVGSGLAQFLRFVACTPGRAKHNLRLQDFPTRMALAPQRHSAFDWKRLWWQSLPHKRAPPATATSPESPADVVEVLLDSSVDVAANACGFGSDRVAVRRGPTGIRGMFAARPFAAGEVVGSIPMGLCLLIERAEAISAPGAPWALLKSATLSNYTRLQREHAVHPLPWSIRAATALLDIADGDGGRFWAKYSSLMPGPDRLRVPLILPSEKIDDDALATEMQMQRDELLGCCPSLAEEDGDEGLGRRGLIWAAASIRSRTFAVTSDLFALCPFVDMVNHAAVPNARIVANAAAVEPLNGVQDGFLSLVATRDVAQSEEITVTYGEELSNEALLLRYGFQMPETM